MLDKLLRKRSITAIIPPSHFTSYVSRRRLVTPLLTPGHQLDPATRLSQPSLFPANNFFRIRMILPTSPTTSFAGSALASALTCALHQNFFLPGLTYFTIAIESGSAYYARVMTWKAFGYRGVLDTAIRVSVVGGVFGTFALALF